LNRGIYRYGQSQYKFINDEDEAGVCMYVFKMMRWYICMFEKGRFFMSSFFMSSFLDGSILCPLFFGELVDSS
jgi:hypothetical protein